MTPPSLRQLVTRYLAVSDEADAITDGRKPPRLGCYEDLVAAEAELRAALEAAPAEREPGEPSDEATEKVCDLIDAELEAAQPQGGLALIGPFPVRDALRAAYAIDGLRPQGEPQ